MISLIVAFRNEEKLIIDLLNSIIEQNKTDFEVVLVNDHSDDSSVTIVTSFIKSYQGNICFSYINSLSYGKKQAIIKGVEYSLGSFLVFTDADCLLPINFIESYQQKINDTDTSFIIGNVLFSPIVYKPIVLFQEIEQVFMMSLFKFFATINKPIACSGANYGIDKGIFNKDVSLEIASGDDIFQLLKAKQQNIVFSSIGSIVKTRPLLKCKALLQQRVRWYRKMNSVKDADITLSSVIVSALFLLVFILFIYSLSTAILALFFAGFLFIIADYYITKSIRFIAFFSPIVVIIYPLYLLLILILNKNTSLKWKDRAIGNKG